MTKHVDDVKIAGERHMVTQVLKTLQQHFGELKISWNAFANSGVQHGQCPRTKETTLDQTNYAASLRTVTGRPEDKQCQSCNNYICHPWVRWHT